MARVVPADKRLPDDSSELFNIGHRASQPRAVQSIYALRSLMASKIVEARSIALRGSGRNIAGARSIAPRVSFCLNQAKRCISRPNPNANTCTG